MVYKQQVEKLLDELKDKSDSESFDDEKERILNVQKANETEALKKKVEILKSEIATL